MTPIPEKSSVGLKPMFEEWWQTADHGWTKEDSAEKALAKEAWHARDDHIEELEASLKIAGEALARITMHTSTHLPTAAEEQDIKFTKEALRAIQKTLSRDLP